MFWFCAALSAAGVLESVICSCLVAELAGYWLHGLLPTDKLPFLNRSDMVHRLLLYGPMQPRWVECYKREAIHHYAVEGASHMNTNFEIGIFLFDGVFRMLAASRLRVNLKDLAIALQRYRLRTSLDSLRRQSPAEGEAVFQ